MRNLLIIALILMVSTVSCNKEGFDADLLYGSWILESDSGHPRPTVDFNTGGDYSMVDYMSVPHSGTTVIRYEITGEFSISGNQITFHTAVVERLEDGTGETEFPYEVAITGSSPFGSFYFGLSFVSTLPDGHFSGVLNLQFEPVVWEIITLTDNTLEVKIGTHTFRFVRR